MLEKTLLTMVIVTLLTAMNFSFADGVPNIYYNDVEVGIKNNFGTQYINSNGVTMVPLEGFMTYFGTEIEYLQDSEHVILYKEGNVLEFIPGESYFLKNGFKILLGENSVAGEKDMYIPLRRVMEVMGREVVWNPEKRAIQINTNLEIVKSIKSQMQPLENLDLKGEITENRVEFVWPETSAVDYYLLYIITENGEPQKVSKPIFTRDSSHYRPGYFDVSTFINKSFVTFRVSSIIDGVESELSKDIIVNLK